VPQITLKAGRASEITQPERRASLEELRGRLASVGVTADLQIAEYIPGRRGIAFIETVAIHIAGVASGTLISNLVTDIYTQASSPTRVARPVGRLSALTFARDAIIPGSS
jgi:hypothetical protein